MMVGHTKKKLVMIKLFLTFIILPSITSAVDPEEFLVSKNSPKNQTLVSLPTDFSNSGDLDDCCALLLFIEVKDLPSGMEPPKLDVTQAQTETGQVTFKFYHPQIHDNPNIFTMDVDSEKAKVREKNIVEFDKCFTMTEITFNISATSTIMEEKDVKIVILNGRDDNITCKKVPPEPKVLLASSVVTALAVSWSITLIAVAVCSILCYKYNVPQTIYQQVSTAAAIPDGIDQMQMDEIKSQNDDSHPERAELPENGRGLYKNDDNTGNDQTENDEKFLGADDASPTVDLSKEAKESSGGVVAGSSQGEISRGNSQEDRGIVKGGKRPRGQPRGPPKGERSTTLSPSNEINGFYEQFAYFAELIKENTPLLVASIAAGLFFVASVIATIICVFLFPSK